MKAATAALAARPLEATEGAVYGAVVLPRIVKFLLLLALAVLPHVLQVARKARLPAGGPGLLALWAVALAGSTVWLMVSGGRAGVRTAVGREIAWLGYYAAFFSLAALPGAGSGLHESPWQLLFVVGASMAAFELPHLLSFLALGAWGFFLEIYVHLLRGSLGHLLMLDFWLTCALIGASFALSTLGAAGLARAATEAVTDPLTKVFSRRLLIPVLEKECARALRGSPVGVLLLDLDDFKEVNDALGHGVGDRLLADFARLLVGELRSYDMAFRYGGDEFVVVLPGAGPQEAAAVAERIKGRVDDWGANAVPGRRVTVSLGVAAAPDHATSPERLLRLADEALLCGAKLGGKGRVNLWTPEVASGQAGQDLGHFPDVFGHLLRVLAAVTGETTDHLMRVATLADRIAEAMGVDERKRVALRAAALFHDLGKLVVPRKVLEKCGSLSHDDWVKIRRHPEVGAELLRSLGVEEEIVEAVLAHHERFDGSGYPEGRRGEEIPLLARVLAVADAHDAMTSPRPYRPPFELHDAPLQIARAAGREFDPEVVRAYLRVLGDRAAPSPPASGTEPAEKADIPTCGAEPGAREISGLR